MLNWQQIFANKHNVKVLFTKFTLLITIQVPPSEHHQSIFVAPTLNGSYLSRNRFQLIETTNILKKVIYALILPLVAVSGLVFANGGLKNETSEKSIPKPLSAAEMNAGRERWAATPDGILYKKWEASPAGKKVYAAEAKIRKQLSAFSNMEAVVTSLSLPVGSRLGFGVMIRIDGDNFIVKFDPEKSQLEQLHSLKVNDKIIIRSHAVSHAPKYSYPIVWLNYVERESKIIYKRAPRKRGC